MSFYKLLQNLLNFLESPWLCAKIAYVLFLLFTNPENLLSWGCLVCPVLAQMKIAQRWSIKPWLFEPCGRGLCGDSTDSWLWRSVWWFVWGLFLPTSSEPGQFWQGYMQNLLKVRSKLQYRVMSSNFCRPLHDCKLRVLEEKSCLKARSVQAWRNIKHVLRSFSD